MSNYFPKFTFLNISKVWNVKHLLYMFFHLKKQNSSDEISNLGLHCLPIIMKVPI